MVLIAFVQKGFSQKARKSKKGIDLIIYTRNTAGGYRLPDMVFFEKRETVGRADGLLLCGIEKLPCACFLF